jgi:enterochelin esterase-like enzyme
MFTTLIMMAFHFCTVAVAEVPKGTVTKHSFTNSQIFPGTTRDYSLYVPAQYDPAKLACVHINQDGIQFNAPAVFDQLIAATEMPVTIGIFVAPGKVKALSTNALDRFNRSYEYDSVTRLETTPRDAHPRRELGTCDR